jgi:hypothetical protein
VACRVPLVRAAFQRAARDGQPKARGITSQEPQHEGVKQQGQTVDHDEYLGAFSNYLADGQQMGPRTQQGMGNEAQQTFTEGIQ